MQSIGILGVWTFLIAIFGLSWHYAHWWGLLGLGAVLTVLAVYMDKKTES